MAKTMVEKVCEHCGRKFEVSLGDHNRGRGRFCSDACGRFPRKTVEQRFWEKVNKDGPITIPRLGACWLWTAGTTEEGYGSFSVGGAGKNGRVVYAHRFVLEMDGKVLTTNDVVCHHCDTPRCVRDSHLFISTHAGNVADAKQKGKYELNGGYHPKQRTGHDTPAPLNRTKQSTQ